MEHLRSCFPHLSSEHIQMALLQVGGDPNRAAAALLRAKGGSGTRAITRGAAHGGGGGSPPSPFDDVLAALRPLHRRLGGTPNFGHRNPEVRKKNTKSELESNSDYEYAYMTVLGFRALQEHRDEIIRLNNGEYWKDNPGTMKLEELCGFTMHADRPGINGVLRSAPEALLRAFDMARRRGQVEAFFCGEAFDRTADPCLEGRLGRILAYLEAHGAEERGQGAAAPGSPPPGELDVEPLPEGLPVERVVGEHLRVFRNRCIHRWAQESGLPYERAKALWSQTEAGSPEPGAPRPDVQRLCNDACFLVHLEAAGLVAGGPPGRALPAEEVRRAVRFFVEMETLSSA
eukprot:CAMPEP_0179077812 /NCGR_PEP_ID=MMETSP0796-20121207/34806_1 /TAXON_ID=73915 /ORGANISM="Pyrodinium bahamense, Strain pbaha01" /LENGTH=344 /DNA_ID=CAMNT_0020775101 /DNA_START=55 /DNA_END=1089 /DNA_ORIENTATION=-